MLSDVKAVQPIKQRIYFLDVLKVLGTFLVIFAHLYSKDSIVRLYIYAFHMPLFYIISGIFHKSNGKINLKKHTQKIFVPAVFFCFFYLLLSFCLDCFRLNSISDATFSFFIGCYNTISGFIHGQSIPNTVCWFLFSLFYCKILADIYTSFPRKYKFLFLALLTFLACLSFIPRYFFIKTALMCFPFYILGYELRDVIKALSFKWYLIPLVVICVIICYYLTNLNGKISVYSVYFGNLPTGLNHLCFYFNALLGCTIFLAISLFPFPQIDSISHCSAALLTTVGIQRFFNLLFIQYIGIDQNLLVSTIAALIIMFLCYYMHIILKKYVPFAVGAKRY